MTDARDAVLYDTHFHLWDTAVGGYAWLDGGDPVPGFGDPGRLPRVVDRADHAAAFPGLAVVPAVHVEAAPDDPAAELDWLAARFPASDPTVLVAHADLTAGDLEGRLAAFGTHERLRGVRQITSSDPDPRWSFGPDGVLASDAFARGFDVVVDAGLTFDAQVYPAQFAQLAALARRRPDARIAIDHSGMPRLWTGLEPALAEWRAALDTIAGLPDVSLKLGGMGMVTDRWDPDLFARWCAIAIDTLGPGRIMFGSNAPVESLKWPADRAATAFLEFAATLSDADSAAVRHANATAFYTIPPATR